MTRVSLPGRCFYSTSMKCNHLKNNFIINRLVDFCLSTSLERGSEMNDASNVNKFRSILKDGIVQNASDVCLANVIFLNIEMTEKILEPLSWAIQNDCAIIGKVYKKEKWQLIYFFSKI